jgi:hypothetical protein
VITKEAMEITETGSGRKIYLVGKLHLVKHASDVGLEQSEFGNHFPAQKRTRIRLRNHRDEGRLVPARGRIDDQIVHEPGIEQTGAYRMVVRHRVDNMATNAEQALGKGFGSVHGDVCCGWLTSPSMYFSSLLIRLNFCGTF